MAYYGWVVKRMYFDDPPVAERLNEPRLMIGVLVVSSIIIVILGVYPGPVLDYPLESSQLPYASCPHMSP